MAVMCEKDSVQAKKGAAIIDIAIEVAATETAIAGIVLSAAVVIAVDLNVIIAITVAIAACVAVTVAVTVAVAVAVGVTVTLTAGSTVFAAADLDLDNLDCSRIHRCSRRRKCIDARSSVN